jgi:hypothetical protein
VEPATKRWHGSLEHRDQQATEDRGHGDRENRREQVCVLWMDSRRELNSETEHASQTTSSERAVKQKDALDSVA